MDAAVERRHKTRNKLPLFDEEESESESGESTTHAKTCTHEHAYTLAHTHSDAKSNSAMSIKALFQRQLLVAMAELFTSLCKLHGCVRARERDGI